MGGQRGPGSPVVAAGPHHQGQAPLADQFRQQGRVGLVKGAGRMQGYFTRYFSNQARMAEALAPDWDGRAAMPPWLAPGTITRALGTPRSCRAW